MIENVDLTNKNCDLQQTKLAMLTSKNCKKNGNIQNNQQELGLHQPNWRNLLAKNWEYMVILWMSQENYMENTVIRYPTKTRGGYPFKCCLMQVLVSTEVYKYWESYHQKTGDMLGLGMRFGNLHQKLWISPREAATEARLHELIPLKCPIWPPDVPEFANCS